MVELGQSLPASDRSQNGYGLARERAPCLQAIQDANAQFRICFVWRDGDAYDVEIVDYH